MYRRLWLIPRSALGVFALLTGCQAPRGPELREPASQLHVTLLGLCEDYPEESRSLAAARHDLARTRASGSAVLRIAFGWDAMEPERGQYDWSFWDEFVPLATETYGIRLIPYVCYTPRWAASSQNDDFWRSPPRDSADFERFVSTLAARYGRWIDHWEIWNEPDNPAYWVGDAAQFAELLAAGSRGARRGDPGANVVLGGIAWDLDFLQALFEEHDVAPHVDVVNVHSYYETWHEEPIEALTGYLAEAAAIVAEHGEEEPLWMAETGYSSYATDAQVSAVYRSRFAEEHTPAYQAAALARIVVLALASERLDLFAWYRINDLPATQEVIGDSNNLFLGLYDVGGTPKPAAETYRWLVEHFSQPYGRIAVSYTAAPEPDVVVTGFRLSDGRSLVAAWLPTPTDPAPDGAPLPHDRRETHVRLRLPGPAVTLRSVYHAPERASTPKEVVVRPHGDGVEAQFVLHGGEVAFVVFE